jgi:outer membrane protein OmpA-like peptidoglycan-associated protein
MIKSAFVFTLVLLFAHPGFAQNLLVDPGFESYKICPSNYNQQSLNQLHNWEQPAKGTPDYFNTCSNKMGVERNMFGSQETYEGKGYVGLVTFSPSQRNYREYLQTKLSRPLKAGEIICASAWISAADLNRYFTGGFGMYFSEERYANDNSNVLEVQPQVMNPMLNVLDNTDDWVELSNTFVAKGGEEFVIIGNFLNDRQMRVLRKHQVLAEGTTNEWCYLFIDNVVIEVVGNKEECSCTMESPSIILRDPPIQLDEAKTIEFKNVLFDFDEAILTSASQKELNEVAKAMKRKSALIVEVIGHTDIMGGLEYNFELSKRRAEAVVEYLRSKGISADRLSISYKGSTTPVADNTSAEGRALNRRVEFEIRERKYELLQ